MPLIRSVNVHHRVKYFSFFFFLIGNRNFIEIEEHRIHDDEESNNSVRFDVQHHYLIPFILFFFFGWITYETFLEKSPLDSPLASKIYRQLFFIFFDE